MQGGNKWESSTDATSLPGSSPPRSPLPHLHTQSSSDRPSTKHKANPFYIVQSPSQFDDNSLYNKSTLSLESSPTTSPRHAPHHHHHHLDYAPRRSTKSSRKGGGGGGGGRPPWSSTCDVIVEENGGVYRPYQHPTDRFSARIRLFVFFLVFCGALFGLLVLLIWVTTKPSPPQVSIKNVVFHDVYIGPGEDASGVPTNFITVNCTVQVDFINTAKHLKAFLQPLQIEILYSKLSIAISKVDNYTQSKRTHKVIPVQLGAEKVPLYGASRDLPSSQESINQGFDLPLQITTSIRSTYYVVSKMVTSKFWTQIKCNVDVNTESLALLSSISNSCT